MWEVRDNATEGDGGIVGRAKAGVPSVSNADLRPEGQGVGWLWRRCEKGSCLEGGKSKLYARPIGSGPGNELKVWFSPEVKRLIFPELEDGTAREAVSRDHEVGYAVHPERDSADIAVGLYQPEGAGGKPHLGSEPAAAHERGMEPEVVFHLCNPQAAQYGVATLQQRKPARRAEVEAVLFAASRWNWHLRRTNLGLNLVEVGVEMFKIGKSCGNQWSFVKAQEQVHIDEMGVVDFKVHEQDLYAVRLRNQANIPLYVWVFYFDMTTFSIGGFQSYLYMHTQPILTRRQLSYLDTVFPTHEQTPLSLSTENLSSEMAQKVTHPSASGLIRTRQSRWDI